MRKGSVVLMPFPFTDLSGLKVRPALVLYASARGEDCVVAFISSISHSRAGQFEVAVSPSAKNGLKAVSYIKLDKLATLEKKIVVGELGVLEPALLSRVEGRLSVLFGL